MVDKQSRAEQSAALTSDSTQIRHNLIDMGKREVAWLRDMISGC
jgi:hypothetical protein